MKKILLGLLLLISFFSHAQNYNCLQFGTKTYYVNGDGYLRGMRIDSVRVSGLDTIYYPFQTPRIMGYIYDCGLPAINDPHGGSWLGKRVVQHPNGTWAFGNIWHDTVFINTQASLGDSWIFYNDATNIRYTATMTGADTLTVLGSVDSIKIFTITADTAGIPRLTDPVNGFKIKLSKDHGFAQTFDLYTFPYHLPDSSSDISYTDYYLDLATGRTMGRGEGEPATIREKSPDSTNAVFNLIALHNPMMKELYDFAPGDIFKVDYQSGNTFTGLVVTKEKIDTVTSAAHDPYSNSYIYAHAECSIYHDMYTGVTSIYGNHLPSGGMFDTTLLFRTDLMPEEVGHDHYYHFLADKGPDDSSFCNIHGRYVTNTMSITSNDTTVRVDYIWGPDANFAMAVTYCSTYYAGYGLWSYTYEDPAVTNTDEHISYFYKNGSICYGAFRWLTEINEINSQKINMTIMPNPASGHIKVTTSMSGNYSLSICNMVGQALLHLYTANKEEELDVSNIPDGIYTITATDQQGSRTTQKLVIAH